MDSLGGLHQNAHLFRDFGCIWRTRAKHDLEILRHVVDRSRQMQNSLLAGNTAYEQNEGTLGIDTVLEQSRGGIYPLKLVQINAIVNDPKLLGRDIKMTQNIFPRIVRNRYYRVRHFQSGALYPAGKIIPHTKLLPLPWSKRL